MWQILNDFRDIPIVVHEVKNGQIGEYHVHTDFKAGERRFFKADKLITYQDEPDLKIVTYSEISEKTWRVHLGGK